MMKTLLIAATAIVLVAPALAQVTSPVTPSTPAAPPESAQPAQPAHPDQAADFAKIDTDKNGALTLAEVKVADASVTQADFDKYDADKSKSLSKAEFQKWQMAMKKTDKSSAPG